MTQQYAGSAQVYAGYGSLLKDVQNDNADLRERLTATEEDCKKRLTAAENRLEAAEKRIALLLKEK